MTISHCIDWEELFFDWTDKFLTNIVDLVIFMKCGRVSVFKIFMSSL